MTDRILYTSDGTLLIEIGANNTNVNVSNTITIKTLSANGSNGTSGYALVSNGTSTYWGTTTTVVAVQNTLPTSPQNGQMYWNSDIGKALVYYTDGTSNQWVEAAIGGGTLAAKGGNTYIQFSDSGYSNGSASLTFNKTTAVLNVGATTINTTTVNVSTVNATSYTVGTTMLANATTVYVGNTIGNASINPFSLILVGNGASYVSVQNSAGNATMNSSSVYIANSSANLTINPYGIVLAANAVAASFNVGNSTVNSVVNSTAITTTTVTANVTGILTGNVVSSVVNASANIQVGTYANASTVGGSLINTTAIAVGNSTVFSNITYNAITTTGSINAASHTVGTGIVANSSGVFSNAGFSSTLNNQKLTFTPVAGGSNVYFIQQNDDNFVFYSTNTLNQQRAIWSVFGNNNTSNLNIAVPLQISTNATVQTNTFTLGTSSIVANNGYTRLPNGLLMQWGNILANTSVGNITFSTAFTTIYNWSVTSGLTGFYGYAAGANTTVLQVRSSQAVAATNLCQWQAIGV